jgi:hypothetical protein
MAPARYEITVEGHLDRTRWARWFDGMDVTPTQDGNTTLSGQLPDQAALHGALAKVRDLGIVLISVQRMAEPCPAESRSE